MTEEVLDVQRDREVVKYFLGQLENERAILGQDGMVTDQFQG